MTLFSAVNETKSKANQGLPKTDHNLIVTDCLGEKLNGLLMYFTRSEPNKELKIRNIHEVRASIRLSTAFAFLGACHFQP